MDTAFPHFPTSSRGDSRLSSRQGWYSPFPSIPSWQPHTRTDSYGHSRDGSKDNTGEDKTSHMDAKRFTPNLHTSLVSEILSLRREIERKDHALTSLEESLQNSKIDSGRLNATITNQERELRSTKKQMQLLESGTLSALGDIAKERDDAVKNLADLRKRLEASKSNIRSCEEDARRTQVLWEQDKQNWDIEKRNMERKVHVTEGRLKTMIEVTAVQANNQLASVCGSEMEDGAGETWFSNWSDIISTRSSSVRGRYHLSELSNKTYDTNDLATLRNSTLAARTSTGPTDPKSLSLAEELGFDEALENPPGDHDFENRIISPDALPEENPFKPRRPSVQSQDYKARRVLGLHTESPEPPLFEESSIEPNLETMLETPLQVSKMDRGPRLPHHDVGTQYTPPSSPKPAVHEAAANSEKDLYRFTSTENTANQRRKRASAAATSHDSFPSRLEPSADLATASAACQTVPQAMSPPLIPMIALEPMFPDPSSILGPEMISASTQTEERHQVAGETAATRDPFSSTAIPVIAIHPPGSRPGSSYNNVMLPPQTMNASCQTGPTSLPDTRSVAVQTESIRVDKRPLQVPPPLISAAALSDMQSQSNARHRAVAKAPKAGLRSPPPVEPLQSSRTRNRPRNIQTVGSHVSRHIDLSQNKEQLPRVSPTRSEDLFAGFSDEDGQRRHDDLSDDDDFANVAPIRKTLSKVQNSWQLVPASMNATLGLRPFGRPISDIQEIDDTSEASPFISRSGVGQFPTISMMGPQGRVENPVLPINTSQPSENRKAALISGGALAYLRQRSPSEPGPSTASSAVPPPFPVPTRSSSRKIPVSSSEGNESPTPFTTTFIAGIRNRDQAKPASRNPLRKVRSAAAVPKFTRSQSRQNKTEADSSALTSPALASLTRPQVPRMLRSESTPQHNSAPSQTPESELPSSVTHVPKSDIGSPSQTTSVVDAIAQTMVGEWLWKYVRKRKSFGIVEPAQVEYGEGRNNHESGSGIRHKRWVWLAPHDRAVIWSSKQPTNGSALMGKGGRKLMIQSVLNVRDDTPMPKNTSNHSAFGRSILILTPQRAVKFTAPTRERHQIWLTALSFLSDSTLGMEDVAAVPAVPLAEYQLPLSPGGLGAGRSRRDSIRMGKSRERPSSDGRKMTGPRVKKSSSRSTVEAVGTEGANESGSDAAAEAPQIARVSTHARKRSSTGPRPTLPSAFYSFPGKAGRPSSPMVQQAAAAADIAMSHRRGFPGTSGKGSSVIEAGRESITMQAGRVRNDFFDAVGTVRMAAFVEGAKAESDRSDTGLTVARAGYRSRQGGKKDMSYWGITGDGHGEAAASPGHSRCHSRWRVDDGFRDM